MLRLTALLALLLLEVPGVLAAELPALLPKFFSPTKGKVRSRVDIEF